MSESQTQSSNSVQSKRILEAAIKVFLRYGLKGTSMAEAAKAAGLSRQGLYLHYGSKEILFSATIRYLVAQILENAEAAAKNKEISSGQRLMAVFEALHGLTVHLASREHMNELLQSALSLEPNLVADLERSFIEIITSILVQSGATSRWKKAGIRPPELAQLLFSASNGIKSSGVALEEYRKQMRIAITVIASVN